MYLPGVVSCHVTGGGFHVDISLLTSYSVRSHLIFIDHCAFGGFYLSVLKCALNFI